MLHHPRGGQVAAIEPLISLSSPVSWFARPLHASPVSVEEQDADPAPGLVWRRRPDAGSTSWRLGHLGVADRGAEHVLKPQSKYGHQTCLTDSNHYDLSTHCWVDCIFSRNIKVILRELIYSLKSEICIVMFIL